MRLDKFLSDMNMGTRTKLKRDIRKGAVQVNGEKITDPRFKVNESDEVIFAGEPVFYFHNEYYMLNKPAGVITATEDRHQKTVMDFFGEKRRKDLSPVGRLDKDTVGLLLVTNDGEFHYRVLSPKKHIDKEYYARIDGKVDDADRERFEKGIYVDEIFTALPAKLVIDGYRENALESDFMDLANSYAPKSALKNGVSEVRVVVREGKFHQIKRMFHAIGKEVIYLKRIRIGTLVLDSALEEGAYRRLTVGEVAAFGRK